MEFDELKKFYKDKKVLITGHTGFKGTWLSKLLILLGADVYGYSLESPTTPNIFSIIGIEKQMDSHIGDIRNFSELKKYFDKINPEIVFHLAAQPIVRDSYKFPRYTYETNIMGTVNILECIRTNQCVKSFLNVTTDKVYENKDLENNPFKEDDKLDGFDPYSNSKSCSELVTHSYKNAFFANQSNCAISTARAGNVIGGGDFANDRIIPDCVRAILSKDTIIVRNKNSVRPYQHVLEPLYAYIQIAMKQYINKIYGDYYNVGPRNEDAITTGKLVDIFVKCWGDNASWESVKENEAPHEANFLKLDCKKIREAIDWKPIWHVYEAIENTVVWYKAWINKEDMNKITEKQIINYLK